ncbi:hypothetical protein A6A19_04000 [Actinobacillus delphinicola]|uniref:type IV pilus secretin PilQ n=1 Tax=Actinobacillus delphinicola TaxID=51161 RepID=UPI002441BD52|nr:type IV pilus secretin PilQ [Actinobacillus delphinicola]MDG6897175.1 hypothetical protein [Actinobacillus delphinicola]
MKKLFFFLSYIFYFIPHVVLAWQDPFYPENDHVNTVNIATTAPTDTSVVKTIPLKHSDAEQMVKKLSPLFANNVLAADPRTNSIIVHSDSHTLAQIQSMVKTLDKPMPQIMIEARIVTMNDISLKELGVRWGVFDKADNTSPFGGNTPAFPNTQSNINLGVVNPAGKVALQLGSFNGRLLDLELSALEKENSVSIIARPKLLTTYKHPAKIQQGTELPYVVNGKDDTQNVEFKDALLSLEVTPQITQSNKILLNLKITENTPSEQSKMGKNEFVAIEKQEIETQVLAKNGETIVLGGILHDTVSHYIEKVPLFGDIPLIKSLFRHKGERHQKRELIIFVTPKIVDNQNQKILKNQNINTLYHQNFALDI